MVLSKRNKEELKAELVSNLKMEKEIRKIIVFGSFVESDSPNDLDVAVLQDSSEDYLSLALRYRKKTRALSHRIPLDIIPLKMPLQGAFMAPAIQQGEVIYER